MMGTLALSVAYGLFFGNVVLLPLWLQQYMGYTATWAGIALAPVGMLAIVLSPWVGKNVGRIDPRKLATVAFLGFALVLWMRSRFNVQADFMTILIPTMLQGAAMAFFFIPLQAIMLLGADAGSDAGGRRPVATSCASPPARSAPRSSRRLWENRAVLHHAQLTESINAGSTRATAGAEPARRGRLQPEQALGQRSTG